VTTRMVQCVKLNKELPGLERPTYPGDLGKRIYLNISQEAWTSWVGHQTMLINTYAHASVVDFLATIFCKPCL